MIVYLVPKDGIQELRKVDNFADIFTGIRIDII